MTDPNTTVREALDEAVRKRDPIECSYLDHHEVMLLHLLREISDKSHEISEHLNLISSSLQGIEMNTRPKP